MARRQGRQEKKKILGMIPPSILWLHGKKDIEVLLMGLAPLWQDYTPLAPYPWFFIESHNFHSVEDTRGIVDILSTL